MTEKQKEKLHGKSIFISSATDPYQDLEAEFGRTHALLDELRGTGAEILVEYEDYESESGEGENHDND